MTNILDELKELPNSLEEINNNPILKPLLEFKKVISLLERDETAEKEYLKEKIAKLNELLGKEIYDDSPIAQRYEAVFSVYKRIFMILVKYTEIADDTVLSMKEMVDKYYKLNSQNQQNIQTNIPIRPKPKKEEIEKEIESFYEPQNEEEVEEIDEEEGKENPAGGAWRQHIMKIKKEHPELKGLKKLIEEAKKTWKK